LINKEIMAKDKTVNVGGINGLGEGLINTNAKDYKELKSIIKKLSADQNEEERMTNELIKETAGKKADYDKYSLQDLLKKAG
jgi:hypothetical protein